MAGAALRQEKALAAITERLAGINEVLGALLVGSLAAETADAASDIDLIICVRAGLFVQAWQRRRDLHVSGALVWWDDGPKPGQEVAVHRWVTDDVVLVEALFATPGSGVRLAPPWKVMAGSADVIASFRPRPPIDRAEFDRDSAHPVDRAFDDLKRALRSAEHQ